MPATQPNVLGAGPVQDSSQAERISVIRQIASQASALGPTGSASNTVTVQIHPAHWGQVTVSVSVQADPASSAANTETSSAVTATIATADPSVRDALQAHAGDLSRALSGAGFHVDKVDVVVQATSAPSAGQGMSGFHQGQNSGGGSGFLPNDGSGLSAQTNGGGSHQGAPFGSTLGQGQQDGHRQNSYSTNGPLGQDAADVNTPAATQSPVAKGRVDYRI